MKYRKLPSNGILIKYYFSNSSNNDENCKAGRTRGDFSRLTES